MVLALGGVWQCLAFMEGHGDSILGGRFYNVIEGCPVPVLWFALQVVDGITQHLWEDMAAAL